MSENPKKASRTVRLNTFRRHRATRAHKGVYGWLLSPGNLQFLRQAEWALEEVATMNGTDTLVATHLRAAEIGDRKIYVWPVPKSDPEGIEMKRIGKNLWANLGAFLEEGNLTLPVNTKERFRLVVTAEADTPQRVPNALCLDLNSPIDIKPINKKKKKKQQQQQQQQPQQQPQQQQQQQQQKKQEQEPEQKESGPAKESAAADQA
ncbi:MAG: hypothetical protein ACOY94_22345 [Bacillota bacterium]